MIETNLESGLGLLGGREAKKKLSQRGKLFLNKLKAGC